MSSEIVAWINYVPRGINYSIILVTNKNEHGPLQMFGPAIGVIVRGRVSEKSFSWAFYEHFSFFTETYSLNGIESTKRCLQFFEGYVGLFYAN